MQPALDHAITAPSGSVIVMMVLLNEAWMCAKPWCTRRLSPRFLHAFFLTGFPAPFFPPSGGADASIGSFFAIRIQPSDRLLLRHRALARALARARVRLGALSAHRQIPPMTQAAV